MATRKKASKAKIENKSEKATTENKVSKPKAVSIDWDSMPEKVDIIGLGGKHLIKDKEYTGISKETAKILVEKGTAKLK